MMTICSSLKDFSRVSNGLRRQNLSRLKVAGWKGEKERLFGINLVMKVKLLQITLLILLATVITKLI